EQPEVVRIVEQTAAANKSTLYLLGEQFQLLPEAAEEGEQRFRLTGLFRSIDALAITLNGAHQLKNAAVAVMTLEVLRQYYALIVDDDQLRQGLRQAAWPGRLELVGGSPRILLDGAHNPEGMEALAA